MGTNYYVPDEPTCNNPAHTENLHIGKSSAGWVFGFHAIPEKDLTTWAAWQEFLADKPITDEYGRTVPLADFVEMVENKQRGVGRPEGRPNLSRLDPQVRRGPHIWGPHSDLDAEREWLDPDGYDFYAGDFS